jgi:hypothetical protein
MSIRVDEIDQKFMFDGRMNEKNFIQKKFQQCLLQN